jgi:hypothetical protein
VRRVFDRLTDSPAEIAISVLTEILVVLRKRRRAHLRLDVPSVSFRATIHRATKSAGRLTSVPVYAMLIKAILSAYGDGRAVRSCGKIILNKAQPRVVI